VRFTGPKPSLADPLSERESDPATIAVGDKVSMGPEDYDRINRRIRYGATRPGVFINRRHHKGSSVLFGVMLTLLGVALLLDNLGFLEFRDIWRFWPVILIAMGVGRILAARRPSGWIWGGIFILGGGLMLARNFNFLSFHIDGRLVGPLLLIGFGLMMLVRALERSHYKEGDSDCTTTASEGTLSEYAIFTGTKRRIRAEFEGGDLFAMFGGIDIDMRDAVMTKPQANLDVQAMFGGVELRIPETWIVDLRGMALFGGYDDKTVPPRVEEGKVAPRLIITGHAVFGGISIRN
jgi:predicted membrane protein